MNGSLPRPTVWLFFSRLFASVSSWRSLCLEHVLHSPSLRRGVAQALRHKPCLNPSAVATQWGRACSTTTASRVAANNFTSGRWAGPTSSAIGTPLLSTNILRFVPRLPLSVGLAPGAFPKCDIFLAHEEHHKLPPDNTVP